MKIVFVDTNVIIDFLCQRDGALKAAEILQLSEKGVVRNFVSVLTMANVAYILRKVFRQQDLIMHLASLLEILNILPMDENQFKMALTIDGPDFEDILQEVCAEANCCDVIVTNNTKHFSFSSIPIYTPSEFLEVFRDVEESDKK